MNTIVITATELACDTGQLLDRVAAGGVSFEIQRHQTAVARLVPAQRAMTAARALAGIRPMLSARDAASWLKDSRSAFGQTVRDPWA